MIELGIFVAFLIVGYGIGSFNERRHYKSIQSREEEMRDLMVFATRHAPPASHGTLVIGNAVISIDYFKRFLAFLRGLLGGQIDAYQTLVERSRREAILRMKLQARELGATHVVNVKLETSRVFYDDRRGAGSVEVLAYGTAVLALPSGS
ncbi:MAG: hypothetical protein CMM46_07805 [Rhodospirillaceae bacterium]|nr:hypothetical protein [Rhodospirillaceae bacterium]|tara:strand:- start:1044 stop:1493 length:450 start_codon:yes stop_codon:yes gene_type:complete